ncbi:hypothetical protein, partial [uncultured Alistipes sp.]|uniref:hypothetical protein n=1 Tax=uncultured Alistipes sp. TaxID=538949 RepID=UPI002649B388
SQFSLKIRQRVHSCYCHLIFERRDLRAATQRSACLQSDSACCQNRSAPSRQIRRCKDSAFFPENTRPNLKSKNKFGIFGCASDTPARQNASKLAFALGFFGIFGCASDTLARQNASKLAFALTYSYL